MGDLIPFPYGPCSALTVDEAWLEFREAKLKEMARPTIARRLAVERAQRRWLAAVSREAIGIDG